MENYPAVTPELLAPCPAFSPTGWMGSWHRSSSRDFKPRQKNPVPPWLLAPIPFPSILSCISPSPLPILPLPCLLLTVSLLSLADPRVGGSRSASPQLQAGTAAAAVAAKRFLLLAHSLQVVVWEGCGGRAPDPLWLGSAGDSSGGSGWVPLPLTLIPGLAENTWEYGQKGGTHLHCRNHWFQLDWVRCDSGAPIPQHFFQISWGQWGLWLAGQGGKRKGRGQFCWEGRESWKQGDGVLGSYLLRDLKKSLAMLGLTWNPKRPLLQGWNWPGIQKAPYHQAGVQLVFEKGPIAM